MNWLQAKANRLVNDVRSFPVREYLKRNKKVAYYLVAATAATAILIPIGTYLYFVRDLSSKERIINKKNEGVILLDRTEKPFYTLFDAHTKNPVSFRDIPSGVSRAFVAVEDKDFYRHPGFSISGIGRAVRENLLSESFVQGGSTISQQLIKNALLTPDKKLLRKYQELVLALELERRYTKDDILEMYLNTIYFGEGAFGIQDAAQRYFSKDARELTLAEGALLAGVIRAPSALSPISGNKDAALKRKNLVLDLMQQQGYITTAQRDAAKTEKIALSPSTEDTDPDVIHFALMVRDSLIKEYGEQRVAQSGFVVKTTLDMQLQKTAQQAVKQQVAALGRSNVSNGAAVVIEPKTGHVLALVGSHDWTDETNGRINMAVKPRQPGSSFKPLVYARALQLRKITASTQVEDKPTQFGSYKPKNYDNRFRGPVLIRYALANSLNIPAVLVMDMIGVDEGIAIAEAMGITTLSQEVNYGLPLVLGSAEIPLVEMTNAYGAFAHEGKLVKYTLFSEIRDKNGGIVSDKKPSENQALDAGAAYIVSSILSDPKARTDTFGQALTLSREAAVKTGTTENYRDALTIGYTPQVVVGVWIGNNDNKPMNSVAGSLGAAPIWRRIMEAYLRGKPVESFIRPQNIAEEQVCFEDGQKVEFATSSAYPEFFFRGTQPTKLCGIATPTPSPQPTSTDVNDRNSNGIPDSQENNPPQDQVPTSPQQQQPPTQVPQPSPTPLTIPTILPTSTPVTPLPTGP